MTNNQSPIEQFIADAEKHQQFDDIPTLCAMLKAAIEGLKELRTHHLAGMGDPVWGEPYHKYRLRAIDQILARLNALATEALGTEQKHGH